MESNLTHQALVVRIPEIQKHPNANTLGIVKIRGYQCIIKLGEFNEKDLAVFVQPDSVLPELPDYAWLWTDPNTKLPKVQGPIPVKYRRITVRRYRKEWSEGLLLNLFELPTSHPQFGAGYRWAVKGLEKEETFYTVKEGDNVAEIMGITHYEPPENETLFQAPGRKQDKRWPRSLRGWFYFILRKLGWDLNYPVGGENEKQPKNPPPIYDVEALKNHPDVLTTDDVVIVTEKIHGSNGRYTFRDGHMYAGSRKLWKSELSNSIWREILKQHPWIEKWCRENPDWTLYAEVVPTQKADKKVFHYGCKPGEVKAFIFDVLDPDGNWHLPTFWNFPSKPPLIYFGSWNETLKDLAEGPSLVAEADTPREGIVIRQINDRHVRGLGRLQLKIISNQFLEKS
jgi:hypothetical protein